ncbi:MAG: hypothetical protein D6719_01940 [Candidatus Dadabacteria bacterium]|nr:MAG: hypothetical protein D6719_01940 [Candidatus Dadabacteria bacterium]
MNPIETIKTRTKEEWQNLLKSGWTDFRIWVQENGEMAAVLGLIGGVLLVLAFKLIAAICALSVLAAFIIWQIAPSEKDATVVSKENHEVKEDTSDSSSVRVNGHSPEGLENEAEQTH